MFADKFSKRNGIEIYVYHDTFGSARVGTLKRCNTQVDGYVPIIRELEGLYFIFNGMISGLANQGISARSYAQLKDGVINLAYSPITYTALGILGYCTLT